ncbi:MAG: alpha/beta fold hydrolase [bacterium]
MISCPNSRQMCLLLISAAGLCLLTGCAVLTDRMVTKADKAAPRNSETGVLLGAEERDLGPPNARGAVLLVHGFVGAGNNFADLPERLAARGWRVRVMRLPGHGVSPRDIENMSPEELLDSVRSELRALQGKYERTVLVGHSMGGTLAVLVATETDIDGLVLAAPFFRVTYHWYFILKPETWTRMTSWFLPCVCRLYPQVNRKQARCEIVAYKWVPTRALSVLYELAKRAGDEEVLRRITCPVLLIHSKRDFAASVKASKKIFERIPSTDKRAVWLDRSNHQLFWDYESEIVMREIERFVDPNSPSSPATLK